jgi:hypothetical protein
MALVTYSPFSGTTGKLGKCAGALALVLAEVAHGATTAKLRPGVGHIAVRIEERLAEDALKDNRKVRGRLRKGHGLPAPAGSNHGFHARNFQAFACHVAQGQRAILASESGLLIGQFDVAVVAQEQSALHSLPALLDLAIAAQLRIGYMVLCRRYALAHAGKDFGSSTLYGVPPR